MNHLVRTQHADILSLHPTTSRSRQMNTPLFPPNTLGVSISSLPLRKVNPFLPHRPTPGTTIILEALSFPNLTS